MAHIIFFEKPGCINNTKQKTWLKASGHEVEDFNILEQHWTKEELKKFFGDKKISECFNRTAPVIKSGELDPDKFNESEALERMIAEPILIKRPLILIDREIYLQGFDKEKLHDLIGLDSVEGSEEIVKELEADDLTICPKLKEESSCDDEASSSGFYQLTPVLETVQEIGLEITYTYDDLVFVEHTAFLFKFVNNKDVALYINNDCGDKDRKGLELGILETGRKHSLNVVQIGTFSAKQKEGEDNIELSFSDEQNLN